MAAESETLRGVESWFATGRAALPAGSYQQTCSNCFVASDATHGFLECNVSPPAPPPFPHTAQCAFIANG